MGTRKTRLVFLGYTQNMKNELTTPQLTLAVQTLAETIRNEIEAGKERAYLAMEQEKRLTYWNVGKHIKEHLLQNEGREDYATYDC